MRHIKIAIGLVRKALSDSNHSQAGVAVFALCAADTELPATVGSSESGLLASYQIRHRNLLSKAGSHAAQLAVSIEEFCNELRVYCGPLITVTFRGERPFEFTLFLTASGERVLGCLRTVSKLGVSQDEWERLWSECDGGLDSEQYPR